MGETLTGKLVRTQKPNAAAAQRGNEWLGQMRTEPTAEGRKVNWPNTDEWFRLMGPQDWLQHREDPQLQEFELMNAMRDRMMRGQ